MIVEDDFTSRSVLLRFLTPYGDCDAASNGAGAVEAFTLALGEQSCYGLICLDIMMPGMDGREVLKILREKEREAAILPRDEAKIIMTTALQTPKDFFSALYEGGCTSYLPKPTERRALIKHLEKLGIAEKP